MSEEVHLTDVEATADTPEDEMVAAYRHDTHKLTGDPTSTRPKRLLASR